MTAWAYYNEIEPAPAHVLRQLIAEGVIADGDVDTRSIKDVQPDDLRGYTQCHFFAGAGLWSIAARLAGWPDDRPLWTGSCPCQPFSQAGQGRGTADERHLWPDFHRLIKARRPAVVVGEQVAGKAGYGWLDGVRADLGEEGYASGAVDIPAAAVDAPHIRQRLYWVALANAGHIDGWAGPGEPGNRQEPANLYGELVNTSIIGRREGRAEHEFRSGGTAAAGTDAPGSAVGDAINPRLEGLTGDGDGEAGRSQPPRSTSEADDGKLADSEGLGQWHGRKPRNVREADGRQDDGLLPVASQPSFPLRNGTYWSDHEWLVCHDGKARRTKPGLRLLVDGMPGRVALWRIAGNAIVAPLAAEVLKALLDVLPVEVRRAA